MKFNNQSNSSCLCFVILYTQLCGECAVRMEWAVSYAPDIEIQMWNINKVYFKKNRAIEVTLVNVKGREREWVRGGSGKTGISNAKCDTLSITTTTTSTVIDAHISNDQSEMFLLSFSLARVVRLSVVFICETDTCVVMTVKLHTEFHCPSILSLTTKANLLDAGLKSTQTN